MTPREDPETLAAMHLEVAAYVEKLSGPDREVDAKIAALLGGGWLGEGVEVPAYTGSLDAAMRLVPDTCTANLMMGKGRPNAVQVHHFLPGALIPNKQSIASATTPALALTAAALRARASALTDYGEKGE